MCWHTRLGNGVIEVPCTTNGRGQRGVQALGIWTGMVARVTMSLGSIRRKYWAWLYIHQRFVLSHSIMVD
jgi:hypothetical protein